MRGSDDKRYRRVLRETAQQLIFGSCGEVDVFEVCDALSITVRFENLKSKARAIVVNTLNATEIRLQKEFESPSQLRWARFLIAHELGHIILDRYCQASPLGKSEYWQHERLCNEFASVLLVPDTLITRLFAQRPKTSIGMLASVNRLATAATVPWLTAAFRYRAFIPEVVAFSVRRDCSSSPCFRIVASTLPFNEDRDRSIPLTSKLGTALCSLTLNRRTIPLDCSHFLDGTIPSCQTARAGVADSQGDGVYRVLVRDSKFAPASH
jgi:hypothetical protein